MLNGPQVSDLKRADAANVGHHAEDENWEGNLFPEFQRNKQTRRATLMDWFFYSRYMRIAYVCILCLTMGFIAPWLINTNLSFAPPNRAVAGTCHVQVGVRVNCFPERFDSDNVNETECTERGCCFQELNLENAAPVCHRKIPSVHTLNITSNQLNTATDGDLEPSYPEISKVWPPEEPGTTLKYKIRQSSAGHISVLLFDADHPPNIDIGDNTSIDDSLHVEVTSGDDRRLMIRIRRSEDTQPIIDAIYGSVFVTNYYSEVNLLLPSGIVYGLGGHPISFNQTGSFPSTNFTKRLFYNAEPEIMKEQQHTHPVYMVRDLSQKFSGVFLESGGPSEVEVMPGLYTAGPIEPNENTTLQTQQPLLVFRTMSNYILIHLFVGPSPKEVTSQLTNYVGRPSLPSLWTLGLSICRRTKNDLADFSKNLDSMSKYHLPYDSDCISESLLSSAFEAATNLPYQKAYQDIIDSGRGVVLAMPPHVDFMSVPENLLDSFVRNRYDNETFLTRYGEENLEVALPDFTSVDQGSLDGWVQERLQSLMQSLPSTPSAIQLFKSSPSVAPGSPCNLTDYPFVPFILDGRPQMTIFELETFCPDLMHFNNISHFEVHNIYARGHAQSIISGLSKIGHPSTSVSVSSRHSFPFGPVGIVGTRRLPTWENLRASLREVLELGISGSNLVSMQVCGQEDFPLTNRTDTLDELCLRWYQLAAYMPALHNFHGDETNARLPSSFTKLTYTNWIRRALQRRIKLAPYIFTQMYLSAKEAGTPLVRPVFYEFWTDTKLVQRFGVASEFMFGDAILVTPVLDEDVRVIDVVIPAGQWFELWSGLNIKGSSVFSRTEVIQAQIPSYLRSGHIIPILSFQEKQNPNSTVEAFNQFNHGLIVALLCEEGSPRVPAKNCTAMGHLLAHHTPGNPSGPIENHVLIPLYAEQNEVNGFVTIGDASSTWPGCGTPDHRSIIDSVIVYGAKEPGELTEGSGNIAFNPDLNRIQITMLDLDWCDSAKLTLKWNLKKL